MLCLHLVIIIFKLNKLKLYKTLFINKTLNNYTHVQKVRYSHNNKFFVVS